MSIATDEPGRPYLYVAQFGAGLVVLDVTAPGERPRKVAQIARPQLGQLDAMYVVRQGRYLYLALGNFFGAQAARAGLAVVDVTDPRAPRVLSLWISEQPLGGSATVLVDGDNAYLGAMEAGVFILDVADKAAVRLVATILPDIDFPVVDPTPVGHPNARGTAIHGGSLFVAYDAGGLRVVDVSDRDHPRETARYINPGMSGKQQAYNHVVLDWPYAYVSLDYCGMEVLDVRDTSKIRQVAWWNPWECDSRSNLWFNSPGHTNQLELDAGGNRVYLSAGDSEVQVLDVSNPARPRLSARFGRPKDGQGTWGLTLGDESVYLSYGTTLIPFRSTWSGIRALSRPR